MKRIVFIAFLLFPFASVAEVVAFDDSEAFEYLKPIRPSVYKNMIDTQVYYEAELSLKQNRTRKGFDLTPQSVKSIASEFDENEIVATEKYKGKDIRIKDVIRAISLDAFGNGVMNLGKGMSPLGNLIASVDKGAGWVRDAKKGDVIDLMCHIDGYVMLNVKASCDKSINVVSDIVAGEFKQKSTFSLPKTKYMARFPIFAKINEQALSKPCSKTGLNCLEAMAGIIGNKSKPDFSKADKRILLWAAALPDDPSGNPM